MKVRLTFKDPDGPSDGIKRAIAQEVDALGLDDDEADAVREIRTEKVRTALRRWVSCDELITIEFDTDLMEATVIDRA